VVNDAHDGVYSLGMVYQRSDDHRDYIIPVVDVMQAVTQYSSFEPEARNDLGMTLAEFLEWFTRPDQPRRKLLETALQEIAVSNQRMSLSDAGQP
jgi:hypothetical protein